MPNYLQLPNGKYVEVRAGESPSAVLEEVRQKYPEAFGVASEKPKEDTTGFGAAASAGLSRLKGETALTAGKLGLMGTDAAQKYYQEQEEIAKKRFTPTQEGWGTAPWQNFKETLGGSVPYMAAPVAAGLGALAAPAALTTAVGAALPASLTAMGVTGAGALGAGLSAVANATQFTGSNLGRQLTPDKRLEDVSGTAAVAAAIPQALLDTGAMILMPGIGKVFGSAGKEVTAATAEAMAKQTLKQKIAEYALATGKHATVEGVTESAQQVLERMQAGLNLADPEAREEYVQSFIGGVALGGVGAPIGHAYVRSGQQAESKRLQAEASKQQAQADALAAQQRANDPEYLAQVEQTYNDLAAQMQAVKPPKLVKNATAEDKAAHAAALDDYRQLKGAYHSAREAYQDSAPAIQRLRQERAQAEEPARFEKLEAAAAQDQPTAATPYAYTGPDTQQALPGFVPRPTQEAAPQEVEQPDAARDRLRREIEGHDALMDTLRQRNIGATLSERQVLARQMQQVAAAKNTAEQAKEALPAPSDVRTQSADAAKKLLRMQTALAAADEAGDIEKSLRIATKMDALQRANPMPQANPQEEMGMTPAQPQAAPAVDAEGQYTFADVEPGGEQEAAPQDAEQPDAARSRLAREVKTLDAAMKALRDRSAGAALPERRNIVKQLQQMAAARKAATKAQNALPATQGAVAQSTADKLAQLQAVRDKADKAGDAEKALQAAEEIDALQSANPQEEIDMTPAQPPAAPAVDAEGQYTFADVEPGGEQEAAPQEAEQPDVARSRLAREVRTLDAAMQALRDRSAGAALPERRNIVKQLQQMAAARKAATKAQNALPATQGAVAQPTADKLAQLQAVRDKADKAKNVEKALQAAEEIDALQRANPQEEIDMTPAQPQATPAVDAEKPKTPVKTAATAKRKTAAAEPTAAAKTAAAAKRKQVDKAAQEAVDMREDLEAKAAAAEKNNPKEQSAQDSLFMNTNDFYARRDTRALPDKSVAALKDGRLADALQVLAVNGSTPLVRATAKQMTTLIDGTKVRIDEGVQYRGMSVEGQYSPVDNTITLHPEALTEETLLHEAVHAATVHSLRADERTLTPAQRSAKAELQRIFDAVQKDPAFAGEYGKLNLAEFAAEVLSNKNLLEKLDNRSWKGWSFLDHILHALMRLIGVTPETMGQAAVANTRALFQPSRPMGRSAAVASIMRGAFPATRPEAAPHMNTTVGDLVLRTTGREAGIGDKIAAFASGLKWRQTLVDRWASVDELIKRGVAKGTLSETQAMQSRFHMRLHEQSVQFVGTAVTDGVPQLTKQGDGTYIVEGRAGANLKQIAEALHTADVGNEQFTEQMFTTWLAVLRAERDGVGYDKLNFTNPPTAKEVAALKAAVENNPATKAAFYKARKLNNQYNKDLMSLLVDSGAMSRGKAAELTAGDYVPYYRNNGGHVELIVGSSRPVRIGSVVDQPHLKELVGGDDKILPYFSGVLQNTSMLLRMALTNMQTKDVAYTLQTLGMATIRSGEGPNNVNVVKFREHGESKWAQFDDAAFPEDIPAELVVQGMQGIKTAIPTLVRAMAVPGQFLRKAVTRMPLYAVRQAVRDPMHAWLTTGGNFVPVLSSLKELATMSTGSNDAELSLQRAGVISSHVYSGDAQDIARMLRDINQGKGLLSVGLSKLDALAVRGDAATRAVLYNTYRESGMTHAQALLGTLESMNFSRRGTSASLHWMSAMIPFFNAQIQGLDTVWRAAKGDTPFAEKMDVRKKLAQRGALVAAATMAYALAMQDDEAYKNATPSERANNWFVPVPGTDATIRVPRPFELGFAFAAVPEAIVNTAFGDTKASEAMQALKTQAVTALMPNLIPTAVAPLLELRSNYSFFADAPIESAREQRMSPEQRFRDNTSELAKLLGQAGVLSPVQIEHLVRGYTSSAGILMMSMLDLPLRPLTGADNVDKPTREISQMPVFGALFQPKDGRGVINEAFKTAEQYQQAHDTYSKMLADGRRADAAAYANEFANDIASASVGGKFRQKMGELAALRRAIASAPDISGAEKREQLNAVRQLEITLAQQVRSFAAGND